METLIIILIESPKHTNLKGKNIPLSFI